ncbi:MAG: hypothetical protein VX460_05300 [Planctomycetota bacterium]|nr:hypothetical protein [Planctomycetota bacterium]
MKLLAPMLGAPTYARARLRLGITGVGVFVVLSAAAAAGGLPGALFGASSGGLLQDAARLAIWLAGAAVLALPFEFLGGHALPARFDRDHPELRDWVIGWLRGALIVVLVMSLSGALLIAAGRYGGRVGAVGMMMLIAVLLVGFQSRLALLVGGLRRVRPALEEVETELRVMNVIPPPMYVVDSRDEGFTGGIAGLPTAERIILPVRWVGTFDARTLALLVARRTAVVERGLRALGLAGAIAWTGAAFALASLAPGAGVTSVPELLTTSLWFTVLSFIGLLVLPTPSRAAALAADAFVLEGLEDRRDELVAALGALDRLADDEPERSPGVERTFHPVPSLGSRTRALEAPRAERAPWHLARTAIYLSIAGLNPLHRLVHCNAGRPDLWVFMPADG